jgi:cell division protease FtsH
MSNIILFIFINLFISTFGFITPKSTFYNSKLNFNNFNDVDIIYKFQSYIDKSDYNNIIDELINNKLSKIYIDNNFKQIVAVDKLNDDIIYNNFHFSNINPIIVPNLIEKSIEFHTPIYFTNLNLNQENMFNFQDIVSIFYNIVDYTLPVLIFISVLYGINNIYKSQINNNNMLGNVFKKTNLLDKSNLNFTLNGWIGSPEVLEECKEVISYLENKEKYNKIGAEMPKGILLEGPPGTGKTLLAKVIASESKSNFIAISGSEFVELYAGMGASKVRDLFNNARNNKPCIIFIDEIDAVGKQRGQGFNVGNDEREQTLNQLLYEMDGFNNNDDIVIIASTNRKDILDQALLRPGRFDRIIRVPVPDTESRIKILDFYLKNKNIKEKFEISSIAELTDGFSGAQLKNLINEAAILSVKNNYNTIQEKFIFDAFEKLLVGLIKPNSNFIPSTKLRVAIHESGHSLLALKFKEYFIFQKASIQPTYNGAGGYTIFTEKPEFKDGGLYTKDILKKKLIIIMGGKAAESIYYGDDFMSLGSIQDLKEANSLSQKMIGIFGMGEKLEVFYNENFNDASSNSLSFGNKYSEHTKFILDKETLNLVKEAYLIAKNILSENKEILIEFSNLLQNNIFIYPKDINNTYYI